MLSHVHVIFQGEGELWLGGMASLAVILITAMAYNFAMSYLNQYPAESVGPSSFACDETIRNAKFESGLKAQSVPVAEVERPIFNALEEQRFTLHLDFINTAIPCTKVTIVEEIESFTFPLPDVTCTEAHAIVSVSAPLPQHAITIQAVFHDIQPVGGVRVGLSGSGHAKELYVLQELNFGRTFFSDSNETMAQHTTMQLRVTKVSAFAILCSAKFMCDVDYQ